jgi:hypothetical protein
LVNNATEFAGLNAIVGESARDLSRVSTMNSVHALEDQACVSESDERKESDEWLEELHFGDKKGLVVGV